MVEKVRDVFDERLVKVWLIVIIFKLFDLIFNINFKFRVLGKLMVGLDIIYCMWGIFLVILVVWFYGVIFDRVLFMFFVEFWVFEV